MSQESDLYALLGVSRQATTAEIEDAFARRQADALRQGTDLERDEAWQRVRYAHEVLTNPQRRSLFDSLVAEKAADPALEFDVRLSSERLPMLSEPQLLYALVTIRAKGQEEKGQRPLNLGLAVDRSTSMRGPRLEKVLAAVRLIIDKLGPSDILSLATFSDRAEVVLPAATLAAREEGMANGATSDVTTSWRDSLNAISASGGTEIFYGLAAAFGEVRRHAGPDYNSHLILLTDGQTYGDMPDCLRLAETAAAQGIGISAFGIGSDWNDSFLDELVAPSGGQSGYIQKPEDVIPYLEARLKGLGAVHAQSVRLGQKWPMQLQLQGAFKLAPFAQPLPVGEGDLPLGDVEGRAPLSLLLEFLVAPQSIPSRVKLPLTFNFLIPQPAPHGEGKPASAALQSFTATRTCQLLIMSEARPAEARPADARPDEPPADLIEAVRRVNLYRLQELAWDEAQEGKLDEAAERMNQLTTRYLETGELQLARQASLEAQRLSRMGGMSPEGRKLLKYGTRSLMDPGEP